MTLDFLTTALKATKQWINSFITLKTKQRNNTKNISKMDPLLNY